MLIECIKDCSYYGTFKKGEIYDVKDIEVPSGGYVYYEMVGRTNYIREGYFKRLTDKDIILRELGVS